MKSISYQQNAQCLVASYPTIQHDITAIGNIEIGIKRNFIQKNGFFRDNLLWKQIQLLLINNQELEQGTTPTLLLLAGKSFGKTYVKSLIGGNFKTNNSSSNFKIGGEIGKKRTTHIWIIGFLDVSKSCRKRYYGAFGLKEIGEFSDNFGVTTGLGSVFFGNNLPKRAALTFGAYHKF